MIIIKDLFREERTGGRLIFLLSLGRWPGVYLFFFEIMKYNHLSYSRILIIMRYYVDE